MKPLFRMAAFGAVVALVILLAGQSTPASALPVGLVVDGSAANQTFNVGTTHVVNGRYNDEGASFVLTSSGVPTIGYFLPLTAIVVPGFNVDGQVISGNDPTVPTVVTVTDDADAIVEDTGVQVLFYCAGAGTTNISFTQGGGTSAVIVITCVGATNTISFSNTAPVIGTPITVTATCTLALQGLTATSGNFSPPTTNGTFVSTTLVNCNAPGTMTVTYTCTVAGTITFTINTITNTLACGGAVSGGLVLSAASGVSATVSGTCTTGILLTQTGPAYFYGATLNGLTITTGIAAGSIPCTGPGTIIATLICNSAGAVSVALGSSTATFTCTAAGTGYPGIGGGYNPYLNTYPNTYCGTGTYPYNYANQYATTNCYNQQQYTNVPSSLTIATASPSVSCGGTSAVTVRVVGTNGQTVADGTAVALAASVGTLSPASATTAGGAVSATYTAPSGVPNTSVTLRATAGAASNTTAISINCAPTAPAASQPSQPPAQPSYAPALPPAGLVISPPNTGDAGLLVSADIDSD